MNNELKCPFCQTELEYDFGYDGDYSCRKCGRNKMFGSEELWQALIQAKQDLEISRKALGELRGDRRLPPQTPWEIIADKALEQIEHKDI